MILELAFGVSVMMALVNAGAAYLMYRQYLTLAESTLEFAGLVIDSIREQDDGSMMVDPVSLAGVSMDHLSQLYGLLRWIRG